MECATRSQYHVGVPEPSWASRFDPGDRDRFLRVVEAELRARGLKPVADERQHGLAALAALCRASPREQWPVLVASHLAGLSRPHPPTDFAAASGRLRIRLEPSGAAPGAVVRWRVAEDLEAHLVCLLPAGPVAVAPEDVARWARSRDELWHLALDNVRADGAPRPETFSPGPGVTLVGFRSDSELTTTHALWIERTLGGEGRHGVVLAVPNRHVVVAHAVRDALVVPAVDALVKVAVGFYREGPDPVSPHLYWVHDGTWSRQHVQPGDRQATFSPSPGFARLVDDLRAG